MCMIIVSITRQEKYYIINWYENSFQGDLAFIRYMPFLPWVKVRYTEAGCGLLVFQEPLCRSEREGRRKKGRREKTK